MAKRQDGTVARWQKVVKPSMAINITFLGGTFSTDGKYLASGAAGRQLARGDYYNAVRVWEKV